MHRMSALDAKNGFGRLIDTSRAEPVAVQKYGRPVVIVLAVEEYERLTASTASAKTSKPKKGDVVNGIKQHGQEDYGARPWGSAS